MFDYLESNSFWIFAAEADHRFVAYAAVARIPKSDARVGYLHIDELHVLSGHRRQGHATRLIEAVVWHAGDLGLAGVRLLVDPANASARRLYEKLGLAEHALILCQRTGRPRT